MSGIVLPNGRYHVSNYKITSTTMNLNGKQSTIFPSSTTNDEDFSEHSETNRSADEKKTTRNELFRISNSTIWMSELTFECGSAGWSIATICGSCVRIGGSRVISNSERTPFVIVGGDSGKSSSITIIACSHTSSCFPSLLPLTSLETSDSWTTHNQESTLLKPELFVTGSDLEVCDACLIDGSGALFHFCGLGQTVTDGSSMTTTLSSSLLLNTTSSSGSGRDDINVKEGGSDSGNCWSVSQKMVGSCVSLCTNHLYGTGIRDLNLGGSVLCSNTSFTHCTATVPYTNQHFTIRSEISTANTLHYFTLCTFKECSTTTSAGGAIGISRVAADLKIESCSFDSCSTSGCGGAIYFTQSTVQSTVTVSSSSFKSMLDAHSGGSLFFGNMQTFYISDCVFLDSQSSAFGGAVYLVNGTALIANSGFSNCLFRNCSTYQSYGDGGAIFFDDCKSIKLDSVSFRDCKAGARGHDLRFLATFPTAPNIGRVLVFSIDSSNIGRCTASIGETGLLQLPLEDYIIVTASLPNHAVSFSDVFIRYPTITSAECHFASTLNTTIKIKLTGTDLPLHIPFLVTLDSGDTFEVEFDSAEAGLSTEMAIGWPDTLQYDTTYQIVSIENKYIGWPDTLQYDTTYQIVSIENKYIGQPVLMGESVSFSTDPAPSSIIVFCDSSSSHSSRLCGTLARPCGSMDLAWSISAMTQSLAVSIRIDQTATLSRTISCPSNGNVLITKSSSFEPMLVIPSSAEMGEEGMIVVPSSCRFELLDVDVLIESTLSSFVFLFASESTIVISDGSITGAPTSSMRFRNEDDDSDAVCSWMTGMIQLDKCEAIISSTGFSGLSQGAINMKGGKLTIMTSYFDNNSPHISSFPSVRRNIGCWDGGVLEIGSLSGGDGFGETSAWISAYDCTLTGESSIVTSPLFVPTLDARSRSKLDENSKEYQIEIFGKDLIPCGLQLEVFEMITSQMEGERVIVALSPDNTESFSETAIKLVLPSSILSSSLSSDLIWNGRLLFGLDQKSIAFPVKPLQRESQKVTIFVDSSGSGEASECGGKDECCWSVSVGLKAGLEGKKDDQGIILSIVNSSSFGRRMWVGSEEVEIEGEKGKGSRLDVDEQMGSEGGMMGKGIVNVENGRMEMREMSIRVGSGSTGGGRMWMVWGRGEVELKSLWISQWQSGKVGMGLVCGLGGRLSLSGVMMNSVSLILL
ncbi:hypothetical protein BLNAU_18228 [Blattamonas nauphoetae]|uniref:Uncharacterized protein n=1 Tax=Blattamonas nauphoetae TaxID=2049346 RepID=A0ABQ9X503_9EUKA|nr:hypothetical protein BLNAU_18228 [Blattamonas nauphoetae]